MLEYEVRQLYLKDEERYYLPIPKLSPAQLEFIAKDLRERGFSVKASEKIRASSGDTRFVVTPGGVAWSSSELLDSVLPSVARSLSFPKAATRTNPYFTTMRGTGGFEIHFFPRMEALGRWSSLRRQGDCGLTPDEALILSHILRESTDLIECVTDYPTDGCARAQAGRHVFFLSRLPAAEFVSNLRTISRMSSRNTYLPRNTVLKTGMAPPPLDPQTFDELGQWCYLVSSAKTSN